MASRRCHVFADTHWSSPKRGVSVSVPRRVSPTPTARRRPQNGPEAHLMSQSLSTPGAPATPPGNRRALRRLHQLNPARLARASLGPLSPSIRHRATTISAVPTADAGGCRTSPATYRDPVRNAHHCWGSLETTCDTAADRTTQRHVAANRSHPTDNRPPRLPIR